MGKLTVATELQRRSHTAYDPQKMQAYMHVDNRVSGRQMHPPEAVPRGKYGQAGSFNWNQVRIGIPLNLPGDVFICSVAHYQTEFITQFKKMFVLTLDNIDLELRLRSRLGQAIGKSSEEQSDIMELHRHFEQNLLNRGAIQVDASCLVVEIVDKILNHVSHDRTTAR